MLRLLLATAFIWVFACSACQAQRQPYDHYGNLAGRQHGLARDGQYRGKRIVAYCNEQLQARAAVFNEHNPLWHELQRKGFDVSFHTGRFDSRWLAGADQLWHFSCTNALMTPADYDAIVEFVAAGKALYLLCDNDPYTIEANEVARRLWGATIRGFYDGRKIIQIDDPFADQRLAKARVEAERGYSDVKHSPYHPLLRDISFIFEGTTVSHVDPTDKLIPIIWASDRQIMACIPVDEKQRVVVDCGYTRYYTDQITATAGTLHFALNVAAWLAGTEEPHDPVTVDELVQEIREREQARMPVEVSQRLLRADLVTLLAAHKSIKGAYARLAAALIDRRTKEASVSELLDALSEDQAAVRTKGLTSALQLRLSEATMGELLRASEIQGAGVARLVVKELALRDQLYANQPGMYGSMIDQLPGVAPYCESTNAALSKRATKFTSEVLSQAASMPLLRASASFPPNMHETVWHTYDARFKEHPQERQDTIARVRDTFRDESLPQPLLLQEIEFLERFADVKTAPALIEALPRFSLPAQIVSAKLLSSWTGKEFGPHEGDGPEEIAAAIGKWEAWSAEGK